MRARTTRGSLLARGALATLVMIALAAFWVLRQPDVEEGSAWGPEATRPAAEGAWGVVSISGHADHPLAIVDPTTPRGKELGPADAQAVPDAVGSAARVVGEELGDSAAELLGNEVVRYSSPLELQDEAAQALEAYRDGEPCVLVGSGYLGVTGGTWGCLVQGDGWVEVRLVSQRQKEAGSEVTVVHMDVSEWERALKELDAGGE